MKSTEQKKR